MTYSRWILSSLAAVGAMAPVACKTKTAADEQGSQVLASATAPANLWLHPWELASNRGEMYLPDLFWQSAFPQISWLFCR